jgi:hypothetical protein
LPPAQRHAIGAVTVVIVFVLVALTTWRPAVFIVPALIVIAGLAGLDRSVVTARTGSRPGTAVGPGTAGPADSAGDLDDIDAAATTMMIPRARPVDPHAVAPDHGWLPDTDDILSWSPHTDPALDDSLAVHTMAIDMRTLLDDGTVWVR